MEVLEKIASWIWPIICGAFLLVWHRLTKIEDALSAVRETRMTRDELVSALRNFKDDTDKRLDNLADKMESTQQKLIDAEGRTSEFRHDIRDEMHVQSMHIRLIAQKEGIHIPSIERE